MFFDDALEEFRCDGRVPNTFWIDHNHGTSCADAKAGGLAAFDPVWAKEQVFAFEELRQQAVQRAASPFRGAEATRADHDMVAVRFEERAVQRHAHNDSRCYVSLHDNDR